MVTRPNHDIHVHTYLSDCCSRKDEQTPARILALAETMGIETIGFADHLWANPTIPPSDWYRPQDESQIGKLRQDLAEVSTSVHVLVGCEADTVAPGKFGITPAFAETLDFVLLSCSHFHMKGFVAQPADGTPRVIAEHMLAFFRSGVSSGLATSIAHPLLPFGFVDRFDEVLAAISDAELLDACGLARDHGVAIEITTCFLPGVDGPFSIETPIRLIATARQAGCKLTFGSDAHAPERQRQLFELAELTAAAGVTEEDVLVLPGQMDSERPMK